MSEQSPDLVGVIVKLIQANPLVATVAGLVVGLWFIGKLDDSKPAKKSGELNEDELLLALAKVRAKKRSGSAEMTKIIAELHAIIDSLEDLDKSEENANS